MRKVEIQDTDKDPEVKRTSRRRCEGRIIESP